MVFSTVSLTVFFWSFLEFFVSWHCFFLFRPFSKCFPMELYAVFAQSSGVFQFL